MIYFDDSFWTYQNLDFIYDLLRGDSRIRLTSSRMHKITLQGTRINIILPDGNSYPITIPDHIFCGVLTMEDSYSFGIGQKTKVEVEGCHPVHIQWGMGSTDSQDLKYFLGCFLPQLKIRFREWLYGPTPAYRKVKNIVI